LLTVRSHKAKKWSGCQGINTPGIAKEVKHVRKGAGMDTNSRGAGGVVTPAFRHLLGSGSH